ncbi:hypothetical protein [Neolewinella persica]|uniref:hypothetical protein n=1 Tax=Neolewinella persica TaxID=70998 RepID=UPI0003819A83|nr:hypothetical protein [Neolewinella persica]
MVNSSSRLLPVFFSLILLTYFILLQLAIHFELDYVLIGVFVELLTIPALLALVAYLGFNFWKAIRGEKVQRPVHWIAVGLLLVCVGMLVWASL